MSVVTNINKFTTNNFSSSIEENKYKNSFIQSVASLEDVYNDDLDINNNNKTNDINNKISPTKKTIDKFGNELADINYINKKSLQKESKSKQNIYTDNVINKPNISCNLYNNQISIDDINVKNIYLDDIPHNKYKVELDCKKLNKSKNKFNKFSHVKSGKIAPIKSSYSIKPIRERIEKENEEDYKNIVLYSHKVNIEDKNFDKSSKYILNHKDNLKTKTYNSPIIVSKPQYVKQHQRPYTHRPKTTNIINNINNNYTNSPQKRFIIGEHRHLVKDSENLYKDTKIYFDNLENKLPQKVKFDELVNKIKNVYNNIDELKSKGPIISSNININKCINVKQVTNVNNIIKYKKKNKNIINAEVKPIDRKKLEEKLELLHVELRGIFDNLNKINQLPGNTNQDYVAANAEINHNCKVDELKYKAYNLLMIFDKINKKIFNNNNNNNNKELEHNISNNKYVIPNKIDNFIENNESVIDNNFSQINNNNQKYIDNNIDNKSDVYNYTCTTYNNKFSNNVDSNNTTNTLHNNNFEINNYNNNIKENKNKNNIEVSTSIPTLNNKIIFKSNDFYNKTISNNECANNNSVNNFDNKSINHTNKNNFNNDINQYLNTKSKFYNESSSSNYYNSKNFLNNQTYRSTNYNQKASNTNNTINNNIQSNKLFGFANYDKNNETLQSSTSIGNYNMHFKKDNSINKLNYSKDNDLNYVDNTLLNKSQTFSQSNTNTHNLSNTNNVKNQNEDLSLINSNRYGKVNTKNIIQDNYYSSYDVELPLSHYYKIVKSNEPIDEKDYYFREHHIEDVTNNSKSIPDDILNTKYISYIKPDEKPVEINKMYMINEILENVSKELEKLKSNSNKNIIKDKYLALKIQQLENTKADIVSSYKEGDYFKLKKEQKSKKITIY